MQPGDIYIGFTDHMWNQGWRPEVEIVVCGINFVSYRYRNCGVPNELCSLDLSKFDKSFEKESRKQQ